MFHHLSTRRSAPSLKRESSALRITQTNLHKAAARLIESCLSDADGLELRRWEVIQERLLGELLRECPGFSTRDYRAALNTRAAARLRSRIRT